MKAQVCVTIPPSGVTLWRLIFHRLSQKNFQNFPNFTILEFEIMQLPYMLISDILNKEVPFMALTAPATHRVRTDILDFKY